MYHTDAYGGLTRWIRYHTLRNALRGWTLPVDWAGNGGAYGANVVNYLTSEVGSDLAHEFVRDLVLGFTGGIEYYLTT